MDTLLEQPLYDGDLIRLGPIDHEKDAEIESRWTHDASFMRLMYIEPMMPLSVFQIKKKNEELEKEADEKREPIPFRIRAKEDDRLVGLAEFHWIQWSNGVAGLRLGIGAPGDRRKGYGRETLRLLLRFAFSELNLYRLTAIVPEYNLAAQSLFAGFGFQQEVCRREAVYREGRHWNLYHYGLLVDEWKNR
ncbi:MAG: GNAT family protein [Chloroflexota bacterium]